MTCYVLVHGAFTDGWYWGETATLLEKEGHRVHVAELPSTGREPVGLGGLAEDAAEVRRLVAAAGEPVVLVGHSYGGMVVTELADDPGVAHTVYVSAFWPARGQAVMELVTAGGGLVDWIVPSEDGSAARVTDDVDAAHAALCADLEPARVPEWYAGLMWSGGGAGRRDQHGPRTRPPHDLRRAGAGPRGPPGAAGVDGGGGRPRRAAGHGAHPAAHGRRGPGRGTREGGRPVATARGRAGPRAG
jgi:pimeloyl-ACP methyl ester carboxylesterase